MTSSFSDIRKIDETGKIEQIVRELQTTIVEGGLLPGTELPAERVLAERLGVSRYSLREALRAAEARGLIEIRRGCRPRVAHPSTEAAAEIIALALRRSRKSLLHLVEARQGLESQIARIAALNARPEHITAMAATIESIRNNSDDPELCLREDLRFHRILMEATDNPVFEIMLAPLTELLRESRKQTLSQGAEHVIVGHQAVLDSVRRHDREEAARAMHRHLELAEEDLRRSEGRPS
jgi:GntR family transcriptional repressor for pyruvate dehydrogenase complex